MTEHYPPRDANHVALTPLSFLHRTADIYPDHAAVIYHDRQYTWSQTRGRCCQLASALKQSGVKIRLARSSSTVGREIATFIKYQRFR